MQHRQAPAIVSGSMCGKHSQHGQADRLDRGGIAGIMDIHIEERPIGHVTVLDLAGKLMTDQGAGHLKDKINSLISQQRTHIVLNLKNVPYIDSAGLGQLVASYGSVMKSGGAMKLLNLSARNHDLLSITRLVTIFESFDSEAEAVQSFQTAAASME